MDHDECETHRISVNDNRLFNGFAFEQTPPQDTNIFTVIQLSIQNYVHPCTWIRRDDLPCLS